MTPRYSGFGKRLPILFIPLVLLAAACAQPRGPDAPAGSLDVLGPVPAFVPNALPLDWVTVGAIGEGQLSVIVREGVPAQKIINGKQSFVAAKPTRATLLATPYLSWAWNMEAQEKGPHPVRLTIGFYGGHPDSQNQEDVPARKKAELPAHDRAIVLVWSLSALERGSITLPETTGDRQPAARYSVRGGRENTGSWWFETLDLSDLYRRAWPNDNAGRTKITFIGFAAAPGKKPSTAHISGLRLSR